MDTEERRRLVIKRLQAGEKQQSIAEDLGVSRQAISLMLKKYRAMGEAYFTAKQRGRHRERDELTAQEEKDICEWLRCHKPSEIGEIGEKWGTLKVKRAILHLTGKRVRERVVKALIEPPPPPPSFKPLPFGLKRVARSREEAEAAMREWQSQSEAKQQLESETKPQSQPVPQSEPQAAPLPSIKEMDAINAESWKTIPWELPRGGAAHGTRTGKRAKANRAPGKKKKRK